MIRRRSGATFSRPRARSSRNPALPVAAIGIANQRETTLVWERAGGAPIYPAIVWQDRRTAPHCERLRQEGAEALVRARTGLLLDPYFSATKLSWILDHVAGARARAARGELAFGTIDSFLLWHLTKGAVHATDAANASRTMLFDIHRQCWDDDLLKLFDIPAALLPEVHDNSYLYGVTAPGLFGESIPIAGMAGDQHAALIGQACFEAGMAKATYGTGCFFLLNTGHEALPPAKGMLTTLALPDRRASCLCGRGIDLFHRSHAQLAARPARSLQGCVANRRHGGGGQRQ